MLQIQSRSFRQGRRAVALLCALAVTGGGCGVSPSDPQVLGRGLATNGLLTGGGLGGGGLIGRKYEVRGVNYSPIPIGGSFDDYDGQLRGNGGDVFWGNYFEPVWQQDLDLMREMGVNTIRVYATYPWQPQIGPNEPRDHTRFLDMLWNGGRQPIRAFLAFPLSNGIFRYKVVPSAPNDGSWSVVLPTGPNGTDQIWVEDETRTEPGWHFNGNQTAPQRRATDAEAYKALAAKYKDHPAVFGWVLGNEINSPQSRANPRFWTHLNDLARDLKTIAPTKETLVALIDDSMNSLTLVKNNGWDVSKIDMWGINSYRGRLGDTTNNFDILFSSYAAVSSKPLIVTEFGPPSTTRQQIVDGVGVPIPLGTDPATVVSLCQTGTLTDLANSGQLAAQYIEGHWKDIVANQNVCAGGIVFAWQDEWYKAGNPAVRNISPGANDAFPGGCWDEEGFGINAVVLKRSSATSFPSPFVPDQRVPRAAFQTLKTLWNPN